MGMGMGTHPGMGGTAAMGAAAMGTGQMAMGPTGQMPMYGSSPVPGMAPGYPSNPGINPYATPAPSYATGTMSQPQSGSGSGRMIAVVLVGLFVVGGSIGAAGLYWVYGRDTGTTTTTTTPPPPTSRAVITGTMQPMVPTTTTVPPTTTTTGVVTTPPPSSVAATGVDAGTTAAGADHDHPSERHVSAADEAQARAESARGLAAIDHHDWSGAITSLRETQRLVGRSGTSARQLQERLSTSGGNQVGILLQQGYCPQAQALYRDLRGVGAGGSARGQFSDDWCPAPH
jgi:hypothetical protein